jgi:hypothetical protein
VPIGSVRHVFSQLLRSGKLRRRLAMPTQVTAQEAPAEEVGQAGDDDPGQSNRLVFLLKMLVFNTLQIETDADAPWTLPALCSGVTGGGGSPAAKESSAGGGGRPSRTHVWKGVTPSHLPGDMRGNALVGRFVDVWWGGDAKFYRARVTGFNATARATRYADGAAGTHLLLYDNGLRVIEHLEGNGEPHLWALVEGGEGEGMPPPLTAEELDVSYSGPPSDAGDEDMADVDLSGSSDDDDDDDAPPPLRVTLRGPSGCMPVGSIGTAAYEARAAVAAAATAAASEQEGRRAGWLVLMRVVLPAVVAATPEAVAAVAAVTAVPAPRRTSSWGGTLRSFGRSTACGTQQRFLSTLRQTRHTCSSIPWTVCRRTSNWQCTTGEWQRGRRDRRRQQQRWLRRRR